MQVNELIAKLVAHSGKSYNAISAELGKSREHVRNVATRTNAPRVDTLADIADVAGVDVVLIDRATGAEIGTVEPPRRGAR